MSLYLDFFVILFFPGISLFALLCVFDGKPSFRAVRGRILAALAGGVPTLAFVWITYTSGTVNVVAQPTFSQIAWKLELLLEKCLAWGLSWKAFIPYKSIELAAWQPPTAFGWIQIIGAGIFLLSILSGAVLALKPSIPWRVRRLGAFGAVVAITGLVAFCLSGQSRRCLVSAIFESDDRYFRICYCSPSLLTCSETPCLYSAALLPLSCGSLLDKPLVLMWTGFGSYKANEDKPMPSTLSWTG